MKTPRTAPDLMREVADLLTELVGTDLIPDEYRERADSLAAELRTVAEDFDSGGVKHERL